MYSESIYYDAKNYFRVKNSDINILYNRTIFSVFITIFNKKMFYF